MAAQILIKENILLNCEETNKEEAIKRVGRLLVESGYVEEGYIDAMFEREKIFFTNMGNGMAIPHGVESAKKYIKKSGIAVMIYPKGILWNKETVKVVIGIAGKGDEHLDILGNIAERLCDEEQVDKLVLKSKEEIYAFLTGKDGQNDRNGNDESRHR